jgi:hypothetical protein
MNHVRFMISPEPNVVQDRVRGSPKLRILWDGRSQSKIGRAPIAQLDRASDYESAGRPFKSGWARHKPRHEPCKVHDWS